MTGGHEPARPAWTCGACGKDWPCDPAREALAVEHGPYRIALAVYMAGHLSNAVADGISGPELYERFVAWTRSVPLDAP